MPRTQKSDATEPKADAKEQERDKKLDEKILTVLSHSPCTDRVDIAAAVDTPVATVNNHIAKLKKEGTLQEGLTVTPAWKKQQLKTYIFIYTQYSKSRNGGLPEMPYQQKLKLDIEKKLQETKYRNELVLENVSIVLGADFDLILVLTAKHMHSINRLVTAWLRVHPYVAKTQTIMVGPAEPDAES